jgi:hypothetical protein
MVKRGLFDSEPFSMLDIGCSGGIYSLGRIFGRAFRAHGFDPDEAECERLRKLEPNPNVHYHCGLVGLPYGHEWLRRRAAAEAASPYAFEQFRRSSAREHVGILQSRATDAQQLTTAQQIASPAAESPDGPPSPPPQSQSPAKVGIAEFVGMQGLTNVDFIKIDTDGCDLEALISADPCIESCGVLGFMVECQYQGSDDETSNTFHNIDRFMKRRGYHIFSMTVSGFSRAALPAPYFERIPSETVFGQPAFGDIVFLRDPIWGVNGTPLDLPLLKLLKLICLYEYFNASDCAAELIDTFRAQISSVIDPDQLLDMLTPSLGRRKVSYAEYMAAVRENPYLLVREKPGLIEETLNQNAREVRGAVGKICVSNADAILHRTTPMRIVTPPAKWAYAGELPLKVPHGATGELWVRIRARILSGEAGFGVLERNDRSFQDRKFLSETGQDETIFLEIKDRVQAKSVVVENATDDGQSAHLLLHEVTVVMVN